MDIDLVRTDCVIRNLELLPKSRLNNEDIYRAINQCPKGFFIKNKQSKINKQCFVSDLYRKAQYNATKGHVSSAIDNCSIYDQSLEPFTNIKQNNLMNLILFVIAIYIICVSFKRN